MHRSGNSEFAGSIEQEPTTRFDLDAVEPVEAPGQDHGRSRVDPERSEHLLLQREDVGADDNQIFGLINPSSSGNCIAADCTTCTRLR